MESKNSPIDKKKPNILFFLPDQFRGDWTGMNEDLPIHTPNFKKMAEKGTHFDMCVCPSPLCSPSRSCLAVGKDYDKVDIINNGQNHPMDDPTFYEILRDKAGYHTMTCGKLDLKHPDHSYGHDGKHVIDGVDWLSKWGFSEGIENGGKYNGVRMFNKHKEDMGPYMMYLKEKGLAKVHAEDFANREYHSFHPTELDDEDYADNWIGRQGIKLIENTPKGKPWFLQVNFNGPHSPMDVTQSMREEWKDITNFPMPVCSEKYDKETNLGIRQNYAAMIENQDRWVGKYMDLLEKRGELENTIIIFASDHGEMLGDHNRIKKGVPYRGATQVPFFICGPGIKHHESVQKTVSLIDLFATILDYGGIDVSDREDIDSISLKPFLEKEQDPQNPRSLEQKEIPRQFARSGLHHFRTIQNDSYKLVTGFYHTKPIWAKLKTSLRKLFKNESRKEPWEAPTVLFDLENDPYETEDISDVHPEIVSELKSKWKIFRT